MWNVIKFHITTNPNPQGAFDKKTSWEEKHRIHQSCISRESKNQMAVKRTILTIKYGFYPYFYWKYSSFLILILLNIYQSELKIFVNCPLNYSHLLIVN